MVDATDVRFPCNQCGSDLRFTPGADSLICEHCGAENTLDTAATESGIRELDFEAAIAAQLPDTEVEETREQKCDSCGAQVVVAEEIHANECPFCASPMVADTGSHRKLKPAAVLPFVKSEKEARAAMTKWLGRLWFAPGGLQEYAKKGRAMQGMYVPYWTYDADTKSRYKGQRGTYYYETRTVQVDVDGKTETREEQVRKTRWHSTSGRVARFFDDILVLAAKSLPKSYTDALAPWDMSALAPYRPEFLAGFKAEGYTVELQEGYAEARNVMNRMIKRDVRFDIGGDEQRIGHIETTVKDVTFKHILLPVWLASYKYRGRTFQFVVNGQSGSVRGERPYSKTKIAVAVVGGILLAVVVGYFLSQSG